MSIRMRKVVIAGAAAVVVAGGGSAVAAAAGSAAISPAVYKGCLSQKFALYNVHLNPAKVPVCATGDKAISWNQTGPQGAQGPQGPQGDPGPQGAPGASGSIVVVFGSTVHTPDQNNDAAQDVQCPTDAVAIGGGGNINPGDGSALTGTFPVDTDGDGKADTWRVTAHVATATPTTRIGIAAWATCERGVTVSAQ